MKILFTNNTLASPAGSELVVVELADALRRRGHLVAAYSTNLGEVADRLRGLSIPVISDPLKSPFVPDLIHGQHHLDAMAALCAFPGSPAIYHCHGFVPWLETSPRHPRIHRYVGMCEVISERLRIELALPESSVTTIPNWVDIDRFYRVRQPSEQPSKALIYSRSFDPVTWHGNQLYKAFASLGIQLDHFSCVAEDRSPELYLPEYDIVLSSGRSALEAMASGCAVIPLSAVSCLGFVTCNNFDSFRRQNFSPRLQSPQLCAEHVRQILRTYSSDEARLVTERVRSECTLAIAAATLEDVYQDTVCCELSRTENEKNDTGQELLAILRYLQFLKSRNQRCEELEDSAAQMQVALANCQAELATIAKKRSAERSHLLQMLSRSHAESNRLTALVFALLK